MPIPSRIEDVPRVVAVDQIDPPGRRQNPPHQLIPRLAPRPGVAGVEDETGPQVTDLGPQCRNRLDPTHYCVVAPGGVLDQHRNLGVEFLEGLAPARVGIGELALPGQVPTVHNDGRGVDRCGGVASLLENAA